MNTLTTRLAAMPLAATVLAAGLGAGELTPAAAATTTHTQSVQVAVGDMLGEAAGGQIQILDGTLNGPTAATPYPSSSASIS